ncbi:MAG: type IX secretion system sortase PorU, partial [Flavobacteriales bacterium]
MIKTLSFSIVILFISMLSRGQGPIEIEVGLSWSEDPVVVEIPHGKIGFENASWEGSVPRWNLNEEVPIGANSLNYELSNVVTENVSESDLTDSQKRKIKDDFDVKAHFSKAGRRGFVIASGAGLRKTNNGNFERLLSATLNVSMTSIAQANRTVTWSDHSVLAEGEWYKIAVAEDGVYRLSRSFMQSLGIDVSSVNPQSINIYGNGGAMLPFDNTEFRFDDPQKNSIFIAGEQDGSFDSNDYILFYAQGANNWEYNDLTQNFEHQKHHYSDSAYYFIRVDDDLPKRISSVTTPETPDFVVTDYRGRSFIETEQVNLAKSGRTFFGESFDLDPLTIPFNFPVANLLGAPSRLDVAVAGRSLSVDSEFRVTAYGEQETLVIDNTSTSAIANLANTNGASIDFTPTSGAGISVSLTFEKGVASAEGWLDYLRVNYQSELKMAGSQLQFRSVAALNQVGVADYQIEGGNTLFQVWDVSDPQNVQMVPFDQDAGGVRSFNYPSDELYEFVAFSDFGYLEPKKNGRVENQDLHALNNIDMVVITTPLLRPAAEELASIHAEDGLEIVILEPRQIYNEFSCGNDDVTAFRMLMKMLYDKAGGDEDLAPKYLQIFGDGNFDNRHLSDNSSYVITYQSLGSLSPTASYVSDDYFGFLDDNAGEGLGEVMQIGVGRIPSSTLSEAFGYVNKVRLYLASNSSANGGAFCLGDASNSTFGSWRNLISFVTDDRDGNGPPNELMHMTNSNSLATGIYNDYNNYDVVKIYMDAYQQISTPGGERYPEASEAVRRRVEEGSLIVNYIGHGGERGWAHERLLDLPTIQSWTNINRLPLFVTATCELARFDDPEFKSAGELIVMNESGGAIAMLTTTRIVFSGANQQINRAFFDVALNDQNIDDLTLGFISMTTKNDAGVSNTSNKRNFSLLGDVALKLRYPKYEVQTTEINGVAVDPENVETIRSLQEVQVKGFVSDET